MSKLNKVNDSIKKILWEGKKNFPPVTTVFQKNLYCCIFFSFRILKVTYLTNIHNFLTKSTTVREFNIEIFNTEELYVKFYNVNCNHWTEESVVVWKHAFKKVCSETIDPVYS